MTRTREVAKCEREISENLFIKVLIAIRVNRGHRSERRSRDLQLGIKMTLFINRT